jgi:hypothetical protein
MVNKLVYAFIVRSYIIDIIDIIIRVKEEVVLILKAITSVVIIIKPEAIIYIVIFIVIYILSLLTSFIHIYLIHFLERVVTSFTLQGVNELGKSTINVGLE